MLDINVAVVAVAALGVTWSAVRMTRRIEDLTRQIGSVERRTAYMMRRQ